MLRPTDFSWRFPADSISQKYEIEQCAVNLMILLADTGNAWRDVTEDEYLSFVKNYNGSNMFLSDNDWVHRFFDDAKIHCRSAESASKFSPDWSLTLPAKKKLKIVWNCSDYVDHIHKTKFGAWFCGRKQYYTKVIKTHFQI